MPHYDPYRGPCSGGPQPGTADLREEVKARFPGGNGGYPFGIYNCRPPSEHTEGRALDYGLNANDPNQKAIGDALCLWLVANADALGVQAVIWNRRVWGYGRWYWRHYGGRSPHTDHVHVGQNWWGAKNYKRTHEEEDLTPEQDARLTKIENTLTLLVTALISDDGAKVKAATLELGDPAGQSLWSLAEQSRNYAKVAARQTAPEPQP